MKSVRILFAAAALTFASLANATTELPHDSDLSGAIDVAFYEDGAVSSDKIDSFEAQLADAMEENRKILYNYYTQIGGDSPEKAERKANENESTRTYAAARELLGTLRDASGTQSRLIAQRILDLSFALRVEGKDSNLKHTIDQLRAFAKEYSVPGRGANAVESSNLLDPETGRYFTQDELQSIKDGGGDISRYNPPSDGSFWRATNIEETELSASYAPNSPLYQGITIPFPTDWVEFDTIKKSQASPKLNVKRKINGVKYEFKLKLGRELHSERTSAALFSALGFNSDPTSYVRDIKVYLKDSDNRDFRREWASYYGRYDLDKYIKSQGSDQNGEYIVFTEALLEGKPEELLRPGPWGWGSNGNAGKREARALTLLSIWVGNKDLKETENNKLVLRDDAVTGQPFFLIHDLGWSFGQLTAEKPGAFTWDLVKSRSNEKIVFNYRSIQISNAFANFTYDDARWATRLIARLSRNQIEAAVALGNWPDGIGQLLVEKLIARRNQLVQAFDLNEEYGTLSYDRSLSTRDGTVVNGEIRDSELPEYTQDFGHDIRNWLDPFLVVLEQFAITGAIRGANAPFSEFEIDPVVGGVSLPFATKIRVKVKRDVVLNREPTGADDRFLVKDNLQVGVELGAGIAVRGSAAYIRDYTLVFPVASQREGIYNTQHILNLFLPYTPGLARLPKKYTLVTEDYLEGKGSVEFGTGTPIALESEAAIARVYLNRLLVVDKGTSVVNAVEDKSAYTELSIQARAAIGILKIPFMSANLQRGEIDRDYWEIPVQETDSNARFNEALLRMQVLGDTTGITPFATRKNISADFVKRRYAFQLSFLRSYATGYSRHDITQDNGDGTDPVESLQIDTYKDTAWRFFSHGERHYGKAFFLASKNEEGEFVNPILGLNLFLHDRKTSTEELSEYYLNLINTVALDSDFIPITPSSHTRDVKWGETVTMLDILFYKEAIDALLHVTPGEILEAFYEITGQDRNYWDLLERERTPSPDKYFYDKFKSTLWDIVKAQEQKDPEKQMNSLTLALRNSILKMGESFRPEILAVIHKIVGSDNIYLVGRITAPEGIEIAFPNGKPLFNTIGENRYPNARLNNFELGNISDIYNFFETRIVIDEPSPATDNDQPDPAR
jgi:hypothetical protein